MKEDKCYSDNQRVEKNTFESFLVGESNKFAYAAAFTVANGNRKKIFNPLFIYGKTGLGKTHLLYAIRNAVISESQYFNVIYTTASDFLNNYVLAIQQGKTDDFNKRVRSADLLLMDDVQFITGKERMQEEIYYLFNALYESNKQIVFASDRPPNEIPNLENRVRTQFEAGIIAGIQRSDESISEAIYKDVTLYCTRCGMERNEKVLNTGLGSNDYATLKKYIEKMSHLGDLLDIVCVEQGIKMTGKEIIKFELGQFCMHIWASSGKTPNTAAKFVKECLCFEYDPDDYLREFKESRANDKEYLLDVPVSFTFLSMVDKSSTRDFKVCDTLAEVYRNVGLALLSHDEVTGVMVAVFTANLNKFEMYYKGMQTEKEPTESE